MTPHRILFIAEGQLGDLLVLTPAVRATKKTYPSSHVAALIAKRGDFIPSDSSDHQNVVVESGANTPLDGNPNVDALFTVHRGMLRSLTGMRRIKAEWEIIKFLRKQQFDAVVCTFPEDRFVLWSVAAGARVRIGQRAQGLYFLLTHTPDVTKRDSGVLQYYCRLARELGVVLDGEKTDFAVPREAEAWAQTILKRLGIIDNAKLVMVHPGASGKYRIWPAERFATLLDWMREEGLTTILCSGSGDSQVVEEVMRNARYKPLQVETDDNLGRLAALMQRCRLCVSNDSGPRHLAVAMGVPTIAIFPQHHEEWRVYPESFHISTVVGAEQCPACPPDVCLDRIPPTGQFGSYCTRMVDPEQLKKRILAVLAFPRTK